jgi:predicted RNA-binding Zn-ribbon protein involved in translation (DUF1610 family)
MTQQEILQKLYHALKEAQALTEQLHRASRAILDSDLEENFSETLQKLTRSTEWGIQPHRCTIDFHCPECGTQIDQHTTCDVCGFNYMQIYS